MAKLERTLTKARASSSERRVRSAEPGARSGEHRAQGIERRAKTERLNPLADIRILMNLVRSTVLRGCHSRGGGKPVFSTGSGHLPEFIRLWRAGVTSEKFPDFP